MVAGFEEIHSRFLEQKAACGGSHSLAPTRGFAAVSVDVAHSHDTWQKPTPSAVFATSKLMLHVAAGLSTARKNAVYKYHENRLNFLDSNRCEWLRNTTAVYQRRTM